ncbi:class I SAM-dependent methyltransferase [Hasllibacter sp. MH4015]|uniref:class I SAM-dependent DNA methyltransferase n=1 Tax=Hasllibacter sp. MH4015 TaxID=2854029 RepID=UPI001CD59244|nr:methyltransferase domain-containing protein [Hasllibacter sp. MH4015]
MATFDKPLWQPRSPEETQAIYRDWAATYDVDVQGAGYATPGRLAKALAKVAPDKTVPLLDFGCGTGLSGMALASEGFTAIDGTDITPEMLDIASRTGAYRSTWISQPGDAPPGGHTIIAAIGVVSLGAAPAETLHTLIAALPPGGLLGFSYNDATLADQTYMEALAKARNSADLIHDSYGDHLPGKDMKSSIYILRKS